MNSNVFIPGDVLDIIFNGRNKQYGAYVLRKFYPNRLKTSILVMLCFAAFLSAFTMLPGAKPVQDVPVVNDDLLVREILELKEPEPIKPAATPQKKAVLQQVFTSKLQVVPNNIPTPPLVDISDLAIGGHTELTGTQGAVGETIPAEDNHGSGNTPAPPAEPESNEPLYNPDIQASFPGGSDALMKFLQDHLQSPEDIDEPVQVRVQFVVGFDGKLETFNVVQSGGTAFSNEVIRVLKLMPKWNPGKKGGHNVRVYYSLPVKFAPAD